MRYLSVREVAELHYRIIEEAGGSHGIRDFAALVSAVAQPRITFRGKDLHPTVIEKAAALSFSLIRNHPFLDGNKRVGHAAMEVFLLLNGREIAADEKEQETLILGVAEGRLEREELVAWLKAHTLDVSL